jgi:hypothetical protein
LPKSTQARSVQAKAAPKKTAPVKLADPSEPPKSAKANADGSFTWTDAKGDTWRAAKTPFGWMRSPASGASADASAGSGAIDPSVKVTDLGDKVRFEKSTPFGPTKWEKSKAELTDGERAALERSTSATSTKELVAK